MWKTLKRKIKLFLWEHSKKNKPMIAAGSVDTYMLHIQTKAFLERLKAYLNEDPDAYRKMQISSYYNKAVSPDFNEAISSHLYVIRLCELYSLQYYIMYHLLLQAALEKNIKDLKLLVFGCGSMIDSLSLSFALKDFDQNFNVDYTGVDIAKWDASYSPDFDTALIQKPLQSYWDDNPVFDGNIIFFPTVISELNEYPDEIGEFCSGLEKAELLSDSIYIMVSYRSNASFNKDWKYTDWQKIQRVLQTMEKKGFECKEPAFTTPVEWEAYLKCEHIKGDDGKAYPKYYLSAPVGSVSLSKIAPDFAPSKDVEEYLSDPGLIRLNCPYYPMRRDQYLSQEKSVSEGKEKPDTVCRKTCPIICHPYPKLVLSAKTSPCFQIFEFHRS